MQCESGSYWTFVMSISCPPPPHHHISWVGYKRHSTSAMIQSIPLSAFKLQFFFKTARLTCTRYVLSWNYVSSLHLKDLKICFFQCLENGDRESFGLETGSNKTVIVSGQQRQVLYRATFRQEVKSIPHRLASIWNKYRSIWTVNKNHQSHKKSTQFS